MLPASFMKNFDSSLKYCGFCADYKGEIKKISLPQQNFFHTASAELPIRRWSPLFLWLFSGLFGSSLFENDYDKRFAKEVSLRLFYGPFEEVYKINGGSGSIAADDPVL